MSRWQTNFENHAFRATWETLKAASEEITVDDETVTTTVSEVARFKKVVAYLDEMIEDIDPELVPLSTWTNFNQQASSCQGQINSYTSNRNVAHMSSANDHADNLLTYVRPYMVLPKAAQASIKRAATAYAKVAEEYIESFQEKASTTLTSIEKIKDDCGEFKTESNEALEAVNGYYHEVFGDEENEGIKDEIASFKTTAEEEAGAISAVHEKIISGEEPLADDIEEAHTTAIDKQKKITTALEDIEKEVADFRKFHITTFGKLDEETGENKGGTKQALATLKKNLEDFEAQQKTKYEALNDEIESLLPGATSAGLATAYKDMKDSFKTPIMVANVLFFVCIAILVTTSIITLKDTSDWQTLLLNSLYKLPIFAPIIWLAVFASRRRSEAQRLQQEYAHKESLAMSYNGYKKQLEELGDKDGEMRMALITKAIESIAENPSKTLEGKHGDAMPAQQLIEKTVKEVSKSNLIKPL